jgi:sugar/nucleoside kinase (ribokinase family)
MTTDFDVFLAGPVFMDIVLSGMDHAPVLGAETWARSMGSCPGGIANMAVALRRLGLSTALATAFGDDAYGDFCRECLELVEDIDISRSIRMAGRHTPLTISLAYQGDRTMVSHGHINEHPAMGTDIPTARFVFASVDPGQRVPWLPMARERGSRIVLNSGWDASGAWDLESLPDLALADVFVLNEIEALSWTRAGDVDAAVRLLAERVDLAVVTRGPDGAIAAGRKSGGSVVEVPGVKADAVDPTGAGDIFLAGLLAGLAKDRTLRESLALGSVAAGLSVQELGGSFSAPTSDEIAAWYANNREQHGVEFESEYGFLTSLWQVSDQPRRPRRAIPTVGFRPSLGIAR